MNQLKQRLLMPLVLIVLTLVLSLCCAFTTVPAVASSTDTLSDEEIQARFEEIAAIYTVGDVLSEEDAEFMLTYGSTQSGARTTATVDETVTKYGTTVTLTGTVWHTGFLSYNYGGDLTAQVTSGSTPQEMTLTISCQAFSLNSEELLSVVYSGEVSHSVTDSKTLNMDKSNNYYGYTLIYVLDTQLDVTTASGDGFTVNAS